MTASSSARRGGEQGRAAAGLATRIIACAHRFRRDEAGSYLVVSGMLMPALLGIVGLGTEGGMWYVKHRAMLDAADSAAVSAAAAYYVEGNTSNITTQARSVAASYGFADGANNVTVTVNQPPASGTHTTTPKAVEVIISQPQTRLFSALWSNSPLVVRARSVAVAEGGKGCVVALDPSASGAITLQGNPQVNLEGCSMYDNSSNGSALTVGGSSTLSAESVNVVGGISGGAAITTEKGIATGVSPIADPYASAAYPSFTGCDYTNYSAKTTLTISPGVYCNGIDLNANANVTMNPGIYYINKGSLKVNGGAVLTGTGVTLVFTSNSGTDYATATINGGANVHLTAPTTGPTAGIVVFGDRSMTVNTPLKFTGGSNQILTGAIYAAKGAVDYAGGALGDNGCLQVVANTISFVGNAKFKVKCEGTGTRPIASSVARLVE